MTQNIFSEHITKQQLSTQILFNSSWKRQRDYNTEAYLFFMGYVKASDEVLRRKYGKQ
jgi:hypothetical protein